MNEIITPNNILFAITILGVMFAIYRSYKDPQAKSETTDAVLTIEIKQLKSDIVTLKEIITNLKDNHLHTLQVAIENTNSNLNILTVQVAKMGTIIDERIPKK